MQNNICYEIFKIIIILFITIANIDPIRCLVIVVSICLTALIIMPVEKPYITYQSTYYVSP
jgi:hypothetical protein